NWGPRLISNGVDFNDFVRTTSSISHWDEWLDSWSATADVHQALALEAQEAGHLQSAAEAFLRAAVTYHFAKFVWVLDPERNHQATRAAIGALYAAHRILEPSARRIEADLDGERLAAKLRRPAEPERAPLVILLSGL